MNVKIFIFLLIVTVSQAATTFAQYAIVKKNSNVVKKKMQPDTARLSLLLKVAHIQVNTIPSSRLVKDSIEREIALAVKINDQLKSDKYYGLIALVQANVFNQRDDDDSTLFYAGSAIPYLQKINAYQELGEAYQLYAKYIPDDNYKLKINVLRKSKFYFQQAGDQSGIKKTNQYIYDYSSDYRDYMSANRRVKMLEKSVIPRKKNKEQALLLLKIAEYEIKKPQELTADLDRAKYLIQQATKINDDIKNPECEALIAVTWADFYEERSTALAWADEYKDRRNSKDAIAALQNGIKSLLGARSENVFIGDLYCRLSDAYSKDGRTFNAMVNADLTAIHYYQLSGQVKKMADVYLSLGYINADNKVDLANSEFEQALKLYKSVHYRDLARVYSALADIAHVKGDIDETVLLNLECEKYITASTPHFLQIHCAKDLMFSYYHSDMLPQAFFWGEKLRDVSRIAGDFDAYYTSLQILTIILDQNHQPKEALERLQETVKKNPPQNLIQERDANEAFAESLASLHQYAKAETYMIRYDKSLENYSEEYDVGTESYYVNLSICLYYLAHFYAVIGKPLQAKAYLRKMNTLTAKAVTLWPQRANAMEELEFKIDTALKDYKSALQHYEHSSRVKDLLLNASKIKAIEELNVRYATEGRLKDIKLLENRSEIQTGQLKHITFQKNAMIAGIIFIFLVSLFIFLNYRAKQRANRELESKQELINEQNAALESLVCQKDELLQDKERLLHEKELLMREIQHRVKNNLHMISSLFESQSAYLEDEALIAIQKGQHRIQAISLVHQKLYMNTDVMKVSMDVYLRELINYLRESVITEQNIVFDIDMDVIGLSGGQAIPIGLIVNEAITNSIKYAFKDRHLGHIGISLKQQAGKYLSLSIFDDGIGLPPDHEEKSKPGCMGIKLIKGLAKTIGAEVFVLPAPGTTINLRFLKVEPFKANSDHKISFKG